MITVKDIINFIKPIAFWGNEEVVVSNIKQLSVDNKDPHALMWCSPKNLSQLKSIKSGTIICSDHPEIRRNHDCNYIIVNNPRQVFQQIIKKYFYNEANLYSGISNTAVIHQTVVIGDIVYIGEFVVIEEGCVIGNHVLIDHHTVIKKNTIIGDGVKIGASSVIGGIGFGYEKNENNKYELIPHLGNVVIEDFVEIGNCSCIDRAVLGSTTIRKNAKIDNLVHIAHGVEIGENSLVIANAMVAGSVKVGKNVWIAPSSSILNQKRIEDDAVIGMGAVVIKDVEEKQIVIGNPARPLEK